MHDTTFTGNVYWKKLIRNNFTIKIIQKTVT